MKILYAVPARAVDLLQNGTYAVLGFPTDTFTVPSLPNNLAVHVLTLVSQTIEESGRTCAFRVKVLDPSLQPCSAELSLDVNMGQRPPSLPDGWGQRAILPGLVMFEAREPGCYSVELSIDGSSWSVPLVVIDASALQP